MAREIYTMDGENELYEDHISYPDDCQIIITRLICQVFLHIILMHEFKQGLFMLKFSTNNWWLFDNWFSAYFIGLTQTMIVILVELVNLGVL